MYSFNWQEKNVKNFSRAASTSGALWSLVIYPISPGKWYNTRFGLIHFCTKFFSRLFISLFISVFISSSHSLSHFSSLHLTPHLMSSSHFSCLHQFIHHFIIPGTNKLKFSADTMESCRTVERFLHVLIQFQSTGWPKWQPKLGSRTFFCTYPTHVPPKEIQTENLDILVFPSITWNENSVTLFINDDYVSYEKRLWIFFFFLEEHIWNHKCYDFQSILSFICKAEEVHCSLWTSNV